MDMSVLAKQGLTISAMGLGCTGLLILFAAGVAMPGFEKLPGFRERTVATDLKGGYQVVAFDLNRDGRTDLIALASGMPELVWYENPGWQRHVIAGGFSSMINLAAIDSAHGPVIVLASGFSSEARNSTGIVSVLEPDGDVRRPWKVREVDRLPTSHRLRVADFGDGRVVLNAPLTAPDASGPEYRGHVPLVYYRPGEWKRMTVGDEEQGVMHGICVVDWDGDGHDEILAASFLGISLYKWRADGTWVRTQIAKGDPAPWPKSGASDVAVGRLHGHRFLCSIEPWHGNQVVVYAYSDGTWRRHVIDDSFVDGHAIYAADLNDDGLDEIIAGYRGKGGSVYIYTADDDSGSRWTRHDLDKGGISAASCAVADLNGDGRPDIACIGSATSNLKLYLNGD